MIKGVQSIAFKEQPYIIESASVVGKKEGEGPLGAMFDVIEEENLFGEDTWEAAESTMQKEACTLALGKAHMNRKIFGFSTAETCSDREWQLPWEWKN